MNTLSYTDRIKIQEIDAKIESLLEEKYKILPFVKLKDMSWKEFGEDFSEQYILNHVPNLMSCHGAGHDMYSEALGYIEVKSGRLPYKNTWTMNQLHPSECDYYLFVFYNTDDGDVEIYLVPSDDIQDKEKFSLTKQHEPGCYSMSGTRKNQNSLDEYYVKSWERLNSIVG